MNIASGGLFKTTLSFKSLLDTCMFSKRNIAIVPRTARADDIPLFRPNASRVSVSAMKAVIAKFEC